jgi:group I intron endonuclease
MKGGIYKITCLITDMKYVGYSVDLKSREEKYKKLHIISQPLIKKSIEEYGWDQHMFEVIEYCDKNQLKIREKYWIKILDSFNSGLNCNHGGGGPISHSEETKLKISRYRKDRKQTDLTISKRSQSMKGKGNVVVYQFDLKGNIICKFSSLTEACIKNEIPLKNMGDISSCCNGKQKTARGYIWSYTPICSKPNKISHIKRPVLQFDLENNFIKEWRYWSEAEKIISHKKSANIWSCCQGKQKTAFGYIWKYKK